MKWPIASALTLVYGACLAQSPDVRVRLDLIGAYATEFQGHTTFSLYDTLGHASSLDLTALFQNGYRMYVSERLQQIPNDPSYDPFEEYYIEDPHIWRLGKQFLPFGSGALFRENVLSGRIESNLVFERVGVAAAAYDGGPGAQRGVCARLGNNYGVSAAFGEHFGISPTSLDLVRRPDAGPGRGGGWGQVFDLDANKRKGRYSVQGEVAWLEHGEDRAQENITVFDVSGVFQPNRTDRYELGWTRHEPDTADFYRIRATLGLGRNRALEPMVRFKDGGFYDLTLALRIRI